MSPCGSSTGSRLGLEEHMEETLRTLQQWELDRLRAVKIVLTEYRAVLGELAGNYKSSSKKVETLVAARVLARVLRMSRSVCK